MGGCELSYSSAQLGGKCLMLFARIYNVSLQSISLCFHVEVVYDGKKGDKYQPLWSSI